MTEKVIVDYLAIPYTHQDKSIENWRASVCDFIFSELSKKGEILIAPISMCHTPARRYGMPTDWQFWAKMDEEILRVCNRLVVITLPGWQESVGVKAEMDIAKEAGKEIIFLDPTPYLIKMSQVEAKLALNEAVALKTIGEKLNSDHKYLGTWRKTLIDSGASVGIGYEAARKSADMFLKQVFNVDGRVLDPVISQPKPEAEEIKAEEIN